MSRGFDDDKIADAPGIRLILQDARRRGASHMIRLQNTNTGEIFPLLVQKRDGPRKAFSNYIAKHGNHFNPIECYDMNEDLENQVLADRTVNWDTSLPVQTGPFSAIVPWNGLGPKPK